MKMENLFVTWQQRSAPASMPISVSYSTLPFPRGSYDPSLAIVPVLTTPCPQAGELETLKQSSRLVHYCATALLFDPAAWLHGPPETSGPPEGQVRLKIPRFSSEISINTPTPTAVASVSPLPGMCMTVGQP